MLISRLRGQDKVDAQVPLATISLANHSGYNYYGHRVSRLFGVLYRNAPAAPLATTPKNWDHSGCCNITQVLFYF